MRCSVCHADDYEGEIKHHPGCDEIARYVRAVRVGQGFHLPMREITHVIEHRPGEGPNSAGLAHEGQGFG